MKKKLKFWGISKDTFLLQGMEDGSMDSPYTSTGGAAYKTTIILIDGKKVKLHIWDTSGQGRFCTIIR